MGSGTRLVDKVKIIPALHAIVPSSSSPKWVSLKGYNHITCLISFSNTGGSITGSAIGLAQATAVAGTGTKVLSFTKMWSVLDDAASSTLLETVVVANTFTGSAVSSKTGYYIIEVDSWTLDVANLFNSVQVTVGNAVLQTLEVTYILGLDRFGGAPESFRNPLAD